MYSKACEGGVGPQGALSVVREYLREQSAGVLLPGFHRGGTSLRLSLIIEFAVENIRRHSSCVDAIFSWLNCFGAQCFQYRSSNAFKLTFALLIFCKVLDDRDRLADEFAIQLPLHELADCAQVFRTHFA